MTFWTETAIAHHLEGRFYALEQMGGGQFRVVDRNAVPEPEEPTLPASRWTAADLAALVELKRQGRTHAECGEMLNRTEAAIMSKWQDRILWMKEVDVPRRASSLLLDDIARVVCGVYSISKAEFKSMRRNPRIVEARQVFYWLAKSYTSFSFPQIGHFCGGKDHSTVIHGFRKIEQAMDRYRTNIELCAFDLGLSLEQQEAA